MTILTKFYKESWISIAVLTDPKIINEILSKGVLILNQVDPVLERYPFLADLFYIVERHGWYGANEATKADIMLVEDQSFAHQVKAGTPNAVHLDIGPADFIDTGVFEPINIEIHYDVIQVSCWSPRKRIELFIQAASRLPDLKFVHLGHFENSGSHEELEYRKHCMELAKLTAPNIYFPFEYCNLNDGFPNTKLEVNRWLNQSKIGVLTAESEGINRFKMECLAANRPCLVPSDVAWTTRKHINQRTGVQFAPNADHLASTISSTLAQLTSFSPRQYILETTGKQKSIKMLKQALRSVCHRDGSTFRYHDLDWDGRNESLLWGQNAVELIKSLELKFNNLLNISSKI